MTDQHPLSDAFALIAEAKSAESSDPLEVYRAFRDTFSTDQGRNVLAWICREAGIFGLNENALPDNMMREMSGRRHLVHWIIKQMAMPPAPEKREGKPVAPLDRS